MKFNADDTIVLVVGKDITSISGNANKVLNDLKNWFQNNKLIINKAKILALSFNNRQKGIQLKTQLIYNGNIIEYCSVA